MQKGFYTVVFAHDAHGRIRKLKLPAAIVNLILAAALVGVGTVLVFAASYLHLLLKAADTDQLRAERALLQQQNRTLQQNFVETSERLTSLESLANEVASTYGLLRLRQTPFGTLESAGVGLPVNEFTDFAETLARFRYLRHNATAVALYAGGTRPLPGQNLSQLRYLPSLWPVRGRLTAGFGDRMDPFNGEGTFHSGVDISTGFGEEVRAAADGIVVAADRNAGYGRVVVVDHGAGITTWYAHLSAYRVAAGQAVQRGDIIGYVGSSGRSTGPHLHYEVRLYDAPVNPWRFLRHDRFYTARTIAWTANGGG